MELKGFSARRFADGFAALASIQPEVRAEGDEVGRR
jgi:hypothetical protein